MKRTLHPRGWPRPRGYSYGAEAEGRMIFVAGQIGTDETGRFVGPDLVSQVERALENIVTVLSQAGGEPADVVRMTWFVTDIEEYRRTQRELGVVYRRVMGTHYPPMTLVAINALVEPEARVEIETTAVVSASGAGR